MRLRAAIFQKLWLMGHQAPEHQTPVRRRTMEKGYKKLFVWQKANELAYQIYTTTRPFPKEEIYGITSQIRRSSLSVAANLVEGYGRQGKKELKQFVNIALGSLAETEYF